MLHVSLESAQLQLGECSVTMDTQAEKSARKVLSAAQALGYRPNLLARSLITGRTKTIGVVAGDIQSPFTPAFCEGSPM